MVSRLKILAILINLICTPLTCQANEDALAGFDEWVEAVMDEWKTPGLAIAIIDDERVVLSKGYGHRNLEEQIPVTPDTLFPIGSNTKSFTALLLGMLVNDGKLTWDTPIKEILTDFQLQDPIATAQMTTRDLLCHRSGLPRHDFCWISGGRTRNEIYQAQRYLKPTEPFRSKFQYSNLMFTTAGILTERITGRTWEQSVRERICKPLDMTRANCSVAELQQDDDFAFGYEWDGEKNVRIPIRSVETGAPAGAVNASVSDMARYVQLYLNDGKANGTQLLSKENILILQTPQMLLPSSYRDGVRSPSEFGDFAYGLGHFVSSYRGREFVFHGGWIDGYASAMEWFPKEKIGVVILSNTSSHSALPEIAREVYDRLLGEEKIDWLERKRKEDAKTRTSLENEKKKVLEAAHPNTEPTHELSDFTGQFKHPGYGSLEILSDGKALRLKTVGFELPLKHYHYNVFMVPYDLKGMVRNFGGKLIQFGYNAAGLIDRVELNLEIDSNLETVVFERE